MLHVSKVNICLSTGQVTKHGFMEVGVSTYGGGLWHTWFDRDLTIAGRVVLKRRDGEKSGYSHELVRLKDPIMRIPTLAIHLDRYFTFLTLVLSLPPCLVLIG